MVVVRPVAGAGASVSKADPQSHLCGALGEVTKVDKARNMFMVRFTAASSAGDVGSNKCSSGSGSASSSSGRANNLAGSADEAGAQAKQGLGAGAGAVRAVSASSSGGGGGPRVDVSSLEVEVPGHRLIAEYSSVTAASVGGKAKAKPAGVTEGTESQSRGRGGEHGADASRAHENAGSENIHAHGSATASAAAAAGDAVASPMPSDWVVLHGLVGRPELNGSVGVVVGNNGKEEAASSGEHRWVHFRWDGPPEGLCDRHAGITLSAMANIINGCVQ